MGKHFPSPGNRKYSQWGREDDCGRFKEEQRSHEFFTAFSLSFSSKYVRISLLIFFFFDSRFYLKLCYFICQQVKALPDIFLLLIPHLTPLWSEIILSMNRINLHVLRPFKWPRKRLVLVTVPCALEKNVYSPIWRRGQSVL